MINALTVDVEDYFHVSAFERVIPRTEWDRRPKRVERNVEEILGLLDSFKTRGTFFVLGWVAEHVPGLVRRIRDHGHEIGCHGYWHERIYEIGPARFREDVRRAKGLLEEQSGAGVIGYRAPSFSVTGRSLWALDVLLEEGFRYDSSIFPIRHDIYGMPEAPTRPHAIERAAGTLQEFPLSTVRVGVGARGIRLPVAGGGYLRLLPLRFLAWAIRRINSEDGHPAVLYFHPWEIDPGQPRIRASLKSRLRHYQNLGRTRGKVSRLLSEFRFAPMADVLLPAGVAGVPAGATRG